MQTSGSGFDASQADPLDCLPSQHHDDPHPPQAAASTIIHEVATESKKRALVQRIRAKEAEAVKKAKMAVGIDWVTALQQTSEANASTEQDPLETTMPDAGVYEQNGIHTSHII